MRINLFFSQVTTDYLAPEIKVISLQKNGVICSSVTGFGPGSMSEQDIDADDDVL